MYIFERLRVFRLSEVQHAVKKGFVRLRDYNLRCKLLRIAHICFIRSCFDLFDSTHCFIPVRSTIFGKIKVSVIIFNFHLTQYSQCKRKSGAEYAFGLKHVCVPKHAPNKLSSIFLRSCSYVYEDSSIR